MLHVRDALLEKVQDNLFLRYDHRQELQNPVFSFTPMYAAQ